MYARGKYIVGEVVSGFIEIRCAICFPETLDHATVGTLFKEVVSAGFFNVQGTEVTVYGESVGLKKASRPGSDEREIARAIGMGDW